MRIEHTYVNVRKKNAALENSLKKSVIKISSDDT